MANVGAWGAWSVMLLVASTGAGSPLSSVEQAFPKRTLAVDLPCQGAFDKTILAKLDRICDDCYQLFREPQVHELCRSECFSSLYFFGCLEALMLAEEQANILRMVEYINGKK